MAEQATIQSGIKGGNISSTDVNVNPTANITKYSLFLGGTNVTHDVLQAYDPLRTGFGRIFMVRKPAFLAETNPEGLRKLKHIIEYGNTSINGLQDIQLDTNTINGGYTNKGFTIPSTVTDGTNEITVKVYEFSGSPVRQMIHAWINGMVDIQTGLTHYNGQGTGKNQTRLARIQANQTAEFIYVSTDNTGENVEYACLLANAYPTNINIDPFNYSSGQHDLVDTDIQFQCTKYESIQINHIAKELLNKYKILANSLNFNSGITTSSIRNETGVYYDRKTGLLKSGEYTEPYGVPQTNGYD